MEQNRLGRRSKNNVFKLKQVITDGVRIQVFAPLRVRGDACGLCGNFDGEISSEFQSPERCLVKTGAAFGMSFMIDDDAGADDGHCSSTSSVNYNDREAFKSELKTCVKTEEMVTPVTKIAEQIYTISRPTVDLHLVKKMDNKVCLSQQGSILQIIFVAIDSVLHCTVDMEA